MEEYRLDERELAALQRLYECPPRASTTPTIANTPNTSTTSTTTTTCSTAAVSSLPHSSVSHVRAFSVADTLVSRSAVASRSKAGTETNGPGPGAGGGVGCVSANRRRAQSSTRLDGGRGVGRCQPLPVSMGSVRAVSSTLLGAKDSAPAANPGVDRQQAIARLLAEAALSPPPPIPTRRPPALNSVKIRASNGNVSSDVNSGATRVPPGSLPGGLETRTPPQRTVAQVTSTADSWRHCHDRQRSLDGLQSGESEQKGTHCTPDWIGNIFTLARAGDLSQLSTAVADMQPAMVRNLIDHHGNNLCHVLAACGHVTTLSWLLASCGQPIIDALTDENARGITPSVAAIRFGQLEVIQWLVQNTSVVRDCLFNKDGQRSLLHVASKYGQLEITIWCCDQLLAEERSISTTDRNSETPLHLAARNGHLPIVQALLARGATVTARNNMCMKAYELAVAAGHSCCAEHLLLHEAFVELCIDFSSLQSETARLQQENSDYKNNFREVLSVSRKLLRERDDMCTELGRLHDSTLQLNERLISQLKQLMDDNRQLRDRLNECDATAEAQPVPEDLVSSVAARWHSCRRNWFSTQLADTQHRVLRAEQSWQRLRAGSASQPVPAQTSSAAVEIMISKLADLRAQGAGAAVEARAASDTSLVDSELYQQIGPARTDTSLLERLSVSTRGHSGALSRGPAGASVLEIVEPSGEEARLSGQQLVQREIEAQRRLQEVACGRKTGSAPARNTHKPGRLAAGRPASGYMSDSNVTARSRHCWWRAGTEPDLLKGTGCSVESGRPGALASHRSSHTLLATSARSGQLSLPAQRQHADTEVTSSGSGRHYTPVTATELTSSGSGRHYTPVTQSPNAPELARSLCLPVVCTTVVTTVMTVSVTNSIPPSAHTSLTATEVGLRAPSPAISDTSCTESARLEGTARSSLRLAQSEAEHDPAVIGKEQQQQVQIQTLISNDRAWYEMSDEDEPPPVPLPSFPPVSLPPCPPVSQTRHAIP